MLMRCSTQWFKGKYQNPNTYIQLPLQSATEREITRLLATGEPANTAVYSHCCLFMRCLQIEKPGHASK